jgi:hypothetical protein
VERVLFVVFVAAANALVVVNLGWAFLGTLWNSSVGIVPVVSLVTLASFLSFALLEDQLGTRRYGTDGLQP